MNDDPEVLFTHRSGMKRSIKRSEIGKFGISPEQFESKLRSTQPTTTSPGSPMPTPSSSAGSSMATTASVYQGATMDLIKKYFPQEEWDNAYRVMMGESGGRADAIGDNFPIRGETIPSIGLFQIRTLPGRPSAEQLKDPEFNVRYASQMQREQGWGPWTAARKLGIK